MALLGISIFFGIFFERMDLWNKCLFYYFIGILYKVNFNIIQYFFFFYSDKSFLFSTGINTSLMPPLTAASSFSFKPPIGKTLPLRVISPVIAILFFIGTPVKAETIAVNIAIPAEGPSLGVAPSGTWTWISFFSKELEKFHIFLH